MDNYTDIATDGYDPEDFDIDYEGLAEMAEDYGYGRQTGFMADDYGYDVDNFAYAD